jgi:ubiquinone/menaquinone biosynthesis C-methylase UbiE
MISLEIIISVFCVVLFVVIMVGSIRLKIPRKISIQGIDDYNAVEAYDRVSRLPQFKLIRRRFVKKLRKYLVKGTVTDIGCGPGYLLQIIAKEFPENMLIGVDISKEMIERAKANFDSLGLGGRAEFKEGSSEYLPFEDQTQDFVVSTWALHHFPDPELVFNEIHRVLKPGGQMLILDFRRDARRIFFWFMWFAQNIALRIIGLDALRRINEPTGSLLASYTSQEIRETMLKTDFSDWKIEGKLGWIYVWGKN